MPCWIQIKILNTFALLPRSWVDPDIAHPTSPEIDTQIPYIYPVGFSLKIYSDGCYAMGYNIRIESYGVNK